MPRQTTQELAALLSETLEGKPRKKARVVDLEGADEDSGEPAVSQFATGQPNPSRPVEPTPASPAGQPVVSQPAAGLLDTAPDSAGFSKIPNRYFDHLCAHLSPDEQA